MRIIAALGLMLATAATQAEELRCFTGQAYHLETDEFAYTEHHRQRRVEDKAVNWRVTYHAPDGEVIARKHMDFSANPFVPTYELEIPAEGYLEGIRRQDLGWRMIRRKNTGASLETETFEPHADMAADAGFDPFVRAHFDALTAGKTVRFDFAAAGRQDVIGLRAYLTENTRFRGQPAVRFRAELDSLLSWFIEPLTLTYDANNRRLLEYRGISNMHNEAGETFPVRIVYRYDAVACGPGGVAPASGKRGA